VAKRGESRRVGLQIPTQQEECRASGVPGVLTLPAPVQFLQLPGETVIIYQRDHQVRHVRMNAPHEINPPLTWYGESVGHYDGDTLVIDTVGMKMGPYSMIDWYGTPRSEALHVIERYRMLDYEAAKDGFERDSKQHNNAPGMPLPNASGKYLQLEFTIEDKNVFTTPWTATMTYRSDGDSPLDWAENVCAENRNWYPGKEADVPRADKPDF
jgi:hypothetical protein